MLATWIIQDSRSSNSTLDILARACFAEKQPVVRVDVIPFSVDMPEMPDVSKPFVFYGYTTLITNAVNTSRWKSGVFYDAEILKPSAYVEHYGYKCLNADATIMTCEALSKYGLSQDKKIFLRPDDDLKNWAGQVMTFGEYLSWYKNFDDDMLKKFIVVSSIKDIDAEWRFIVVDGEIIEGSQYKPQLATFISPEVKEFVYSVIDLWCPLPVMVIDIAYIQNEFKVIELNCFNGSGFYMANIPRIVHCVSSYIEQTHYNII